MVGATGDLFDRMAQGNEALAPGAWLLRGFAREELPGVVAAVDPAEQEHGREAERDRDDGLREVALVRVAVERQP